MAGEGAPEIDADIVRTPETDRAAIGTESSPITVTQPPTETKTPVAEFAPTETPTDTSIEAPIPTATPASIETQVPTPATTPVPNPAERPPSRWKKILSKIGLGSRGPKPLIEMRPPVAPGSEGRGVIDRGQLRQNLQQEPSKS